MKSILVLFISIAILTSSFLTKETNCLIFDKTVHNFGFIKYPWEKFCYFPYHNHTKDTIKITNTQTSCGCTTVLGKNLMIPPGKTDSIKISFLPQRWLNGSVYKEISLTTNCPEDSIINLYIQAEVKIDF